MRKPFLLSIFCLMPFVGALAQSDIKPSSTIQTVKMDEPVKVQPYLGTVKPANYVEPVVVYVKPVTHTRQENGQEKPMSADPTFPKRIDTGNPVQDEENYRMAKDKWIRENPEKYDAMQQQSNPVIK